MKVVLSAHCPRRRILEFAGDVGGLRRLARVAKIWRETAASLSLVAEAEVEQTLIVQNTSIVTALERLPEVLSFLIRCVSFPNRSDQELADDSIALGIVKHFENGVGGVVLDQRAQAVRSFVCALDFLLRKNVSFCRVVVISDEPAKWSSALGSLQFPGFGALPITSGMLHAQEHYYCVMTPSQIAEIPTWELLCNPSFNFKYICIDESPDLIRELRLEEGVPKLPRHENLLYFSAPTRPGDRLTIGAILLRFGSVRRRVVFDLAGELKARGITPTSPDAARRYASELLRGKLQRALRELEGTPLCLGQPLTPLVLHEEVADGVRGRYRPGLVFTTQDGVTGYWHAPVSNML